MIWIFTILFLVGSLALYYIFVKAGWKKTEKEICNNMEALGPFCGVILLWLVGMTGLVWMLCFGGGSEKKPDKPTQKPIVIQTTEPEKSKVEKAWSIGKFIYKELNDKPE